MMQGLKKPKVTIILPVFNASKYLEACLQSIFLQEFQDWELIAVDDFSTDSSLDLLRLVNDPRVRVFANAQNLGPGATRNFIVSMARGDILILQDADDLMAPGRIALQVEALDRNPDIDLIGSYMNLIGNDGSIRGVREIEVENFSVRQVLFRSITPAHATLAGRKEWFIRNPYPNHLVRAEDKFMIANAVKNRDFAYKVISQPLYSYRYSSSQDFQKRFVAYRAERTDLAYLIDSRFMRLLFHLQSLAKTLKFRLQG